MPCFRRAVREEIHGGRAVQIAFHGLRAWVRMRDGIARALDPRPEKPFSIDVAARWREGGAQTITSHAKFILLWPGLDRCAAVGFHCVKDL